MITAFVIILISATISFIFAAVTSRLIKKRDIVTQDEPFELTELTSSTPTPTPTPVYEKKKRGRKPKTTK